MGVIGSKIKELLPLRDKLLELSDEADTSAYRTKINNTVWSCFRELMPLRRKPAETDMVKDKFRLCVGSWLSWHIYSDIAGGLLIQPIRYADDFNRVIREHGDLIAPLVRGHVREDVAEMVELVKQWKPCEDFSVTEHISDTKCLIVEVYPALPAETVEVKEITAVELHLRTFNPTAFLVVSRGEDNKHLSLSYATVLCTLEDLGDYLLNLYEEAASIVRKVKEHNDPILEKLDEVAAPYRLARRMRE